MLSARKCFLLAWFASLPARADKLNLPPGPNRDLLIQNCLACHSDRLIVQNRMTRKQWDEKITWMQKTQNLWPLAKEIREKTLDYLESVLGVDIDIQTQDLMDGIGPRRTNPLPIE